MTISDALFRRMDITPAQKWLLCFLASRALADGTLSITGYELSHNPNLTRMNVLHNLVVLATTHDLTYSVTKVAGDDVYDVRLRSVGSLAVLV